MVTLRPKGGLPLMLAAAADKVLLRMTINND